MKHLWRAVDHEGEVLESFVTTDRDKAAAFEFIRKLMRGHGCAKVVTTDGLRSSKAAMKEIGIAERQEMGRWAKHLFDASPHAFAGHTADFFNTVDGRLTLRRID